MNNQSKVNTLQLTAKQKNNEFYNIFFHQSEYGIWLAQLDKPLSVNLSLKQQEEHILKYASFANCNLIFTRMHGYDTPDELISVRFPQLFIHSDITNMNNLRKFLQDNFQLRGAETHEIGKNGERKYFLNDIFGIVEENQLVRVWGKQKDITTEKSRSTALKLLTPQELTVLKCTIEGKTLKEIGHEMRLNPKTVDSLRNRMKNKLGASTLPQLIFKAFQLGIQNIEC